MILGALLLASVSQSSSPDNDLVWSFAYSEDGRSVEARDPAGRPTTVEYDFFPGEEILRQVDVVYPDGSALQRRFDQQGRLQSMRDAHGWTRYLHDEQGRLKSVQRTATPKIAYSYDSAGRLASMQVTGKDEVWSVQYAYDFRGNLESIQTPAGTIKYFHLPAQNALLRTYPNGITTAWEFSAEDRLETLTHTDQDSHVILQFDYTYDANGKLASVTELSAEGSRTTQYAYDHAKRQVTITDWTGGWSRLEYDELGRRIAVDGSDEERVEIEYDSAMRLSSYDGNPVITDTLGTILSRRSDEAFISYEYNGRQQLSRIVRGKNSVRYHYDGDGALIARIEGDRKTKYVPDPLSGTGRPLFEIDRGEEVFYIYMDGQVLAALSSKEAVFYSCDHNGAPVLMTDGEGRAIEPAAAGDEMPSMPRREQSILPWELAGGRLSHLAGAGSEPRSPRSRRVDWNRALVPGAYGLFRDVLFQIRFGLGRQYDSAISLQLQRATTITNFVDPPDIRHADVQQVNQSTMMWPVNTAVDKAVDWGVVKISDLGFSRLAPRSSLRAVFPPWAVGAMRNVTSAADLISTVKAVGRNKYDPGAWAPLVGTGLSYVPVYGAGLALLANQADAVRRGIWSQVYTNRTLSLLSIPRDLRLSPFSGSTTDYQGSFTASGPSDLQVWASFDVTHHRRGARYSGTLSSEWSRNNHRLASGHVVTGSFSKSANRVDYAGSTTTTRLSQSRYNVSFNGADINRNVIPKHLGGGADFTRSAPRMPATPVSHYVPPARSIADPIVFVRPSPVGGVYMKGAGNLLRGLGQLQGIGVDADTGRLILMAGEADITLPPLRLDDLVTIFRTVYFEGISPFVSIDPAKQDPEGPQLVIRHGPGTEDSYVGWVLFECDRLMKAYNLGQDNVTRKPVVSRVPGYESGFEMLAADAMAKLAGSADLWDEEDGTVWERFWIVPAAVDQSVSGDDLTMFDVPLMVKTERMVLRNGKLETDTDHSSTAGALQFSNWFTDNYDAIAEECLSTPPGGTEAVKVFVELRRIAVIAAIAERLCDQGVPYPLWMMDYEVSPLHMDKTTPSLVRKGIAKTSSRQIAYRLYGGVDLLADDSVVHTLKADGPTKRLHLESKVATASVPTLQSVTIPSGNQADQGRSTTAVALPGAGTVDIGACRYVVTDIELPIRLGYRIRLQRIYHSFFGPMESMGPMWTLDEPRLWPQVRCVKHEKGVKEFEPAFLLSSPLSSVHATFQEILMVPEVGAELMVTHDSDDILGLGPAHLPGKRLGGKLNAVLFRGGAQWLFDENGRLAARVQAPFTEIFRRDGEGRVTRIEGWIGDELEGRIALSYDEHGQLSSAEAVGQETSYSYNDEGFLTEVDGPTEKSRYVYSKGRLVRVLQDGEVVRRYIYDKRGRILGMQDGAGNSYVYVTSGSKDGGTLVTVTTSAPGVPERSIRYDSSFRPVEEITEGARHIVWTHDSDGRGKTVASQQGKELMTIEHSDALTAHMRLPDGRTFSLTTNVDGNVASFTEGEQATLQCAWRPDGQLDSAILDSYALHAAYGQDAELEEIFLTPPESGQDYESWQSFKLDDKGRIRQVTDSSGVVVDVKYDASGLPSDIKSDSNRVRIARRADGQIRRIDHSSGYHEERSYDAEGELRAIISKQAGKTARAKFRDGHLVSLKSFDEQKVSVDYYEDGPNEGLPRRVVAPSGVETHYAYDSQSQVTSVEHKGFSKTQYIYDSDGRLTKIVRGSGK